MFDNCDDKHFRHRNNLYKCEWNLKEATTTTTKTLHTQKGLHKMTGTVSGLLTL